MVVPGVSVRVVETGEVHALAPAAAVRGEQHKLHAAVTA